MTTFTHDTVPTQFIEANGIRFAYRRFGKAGAVPIFLNVHYRGTMDHWDPLITDGLAKEREVILFDNAGNRSRRTPPWQISRPMRRPKVRSTRWSSTSP